MSRSHLQRRPNSRIRTLIQRNQVFQHSITKSNTRQNQNGSLLMPIINRRLTPHSTIRVNHGKHKGNLTLTFVTLILILPNTTRVPKRPITIFQSRPIIRRLHFLRKQHPSLQILQRRLQRPYNTHLLHTSTSSTKLFQPPLKIPFKRINRASPRESCSPTSSAIAIAESPNSDISGP